MNPTRATPRSGRTFPQTDQSYQSSHVARSLRNASQVPPPAFFEISNDYFAEEAPRSFAVDAGVFAALILAAMLPDRERRRGRLRLSSAASACFKRQE